MSYDLVVEEAVQSMAYGEFLIDNGVLGRISTADMANFNALFRHLVSTYPDVLFEVVRDIDCMTTKIRWEPAPPPEVVTGDISAELLLRLSERTGLEVLTCFDFLQNGWTFTSRLNQPDIWEIDALKDHNLTEPMIKDLHMGGWKPEGRYYYHKWVRRL